MPQGKTSLHGNQNCMIVYKGWERMCEQKGRRLDVGRVTSGVVVETVILAIFVENRDRKHNYMF